MSETIHDVSDTALWVAVYRAQETARPDALFHDPIAARLAGERGKRIAEAMGRTKLVAWMLAVRTRMIDEYIADLVAGGVDTILNLGAGLDTRPYRLDLPPSLQWIEVDYANIIDLKEDRLRGETPRCQLRRVRLDLADRAARQKLFAEISAHSGAVGVLTEGVIPYLSNDAVAALADDLRAQRNFRFWIVDYIAPSLLRFSRLAQRGMENAPLQFHPADPIGFFNAHGWKEREIRYLIEEGDKRGRPLPTPWWTIPLLALMPRDKRRRLRGYMLLEPN